MMSNIDTRHVLQDVLGDFRGNCPSLYNKALELPI